MKLHQPAAQLYIPDGAPEPGALSRITDLEAQLEGREDQIAALEGGMMKQPAVQATPMAREIQRNRL